MSSEIRRLGGNLDLVRIAIGGYSVQLFTGYGRCQPDLLGDSLHFCCASFIHAFSHLLINTHEVFRIWVKDWRKLVTNQWIVMKFFLGICFLHLTFWCTWLWILLFYLGQRNICVTFQEGEGCLLSLSLYCDSSVNKISCFIPETGIFKCQKN